MSRTRTNKEKLFDIIRKPIITEKSTNAAALSKYTFEVNMNATKVEIAQAVEQAFPGRKVTKVCTVYMPSHTKRLGRHYGRTAAYKKAIVTVAGEPIEELTAV